MARLIDADEFYRKAIDYIVTGGAPTTNYKEGLHDGATRILCIADNLPTVDAVEVVRCKDCVYRKNNQKCPKCHAVYNNSYEYILDFASDEDFCHKGKRGTDE